VARDFITLLLFSGMRKGEAGGLRWDDVDFAAKIIRVPGANTKSGRQLDLPMTDVVHDLLVTRRAVGRDKFVFPTQRGHIKDPRAAIKTITASTGIEFSLHDLRRTYATNARTAGVDFLALKALLNHSQPQDTTGGYTVLSVEQVRVDAQKVTDPPEGAVRHRAAGRRQRPQAELS
jgi:integrase